MAPMKNTGPTTSCQPDTLLSAIADYVDSCLIESRVAYDTARLALLDALACGFEAIGQPECTKLLGPVVPGTTVPIGAKVPGTFFYLDPVTAAFNITCMVRWLDYSDAWLALESGHPSDNLGAVLATADYQSRLNITQGKPPLRLKEVLTALIKAYEIQGLIGLENSLGRNGYDHVGLVRVASAAVATRLLGGNRDEIMSAASNAWADGLPLRVYRQAPNTGYRKSWAGGDATSRGVRLALIARTGEMGYPTALSTKAWGSNAMLLGGAPLKVSRPFGSFVMENVLFKVAYPGVIHAQTALEAAIKLHPLVRNRITEIERIEVWSYALAIRTADKLGQLHNAADRDHCLQYMVAVGLIRGDLTSADFQDAAASDPRIDALRMKIIVREDKAFTRDFLDTTQRSCANGIKVTFSNRTSTPRINIKYPLGHRQRRVEGLPLLERKLEKGLCCRFPRKHVDKILRIVQDTQSFESIYVNDFTDALSW